MKRRCERVPLPRRRTPVHELWLDWYGRERSERRPRGRRYRL